MRKIIIVSLVAISLSLFSTPAMSYATSPKLSERDLAEYLKHNSPTRIIEPRYLGNDEPGRGSLQGETAVLLTESSSKSPTLYGAIPSWCDDVSVIVFPDTANIETGDGLYLYSGLLTDDAIYEDLKVWQLDLQEAGLGLITESTMYMLQLALRMAWEVSLYIVTSSTTKCPYTPKLATLCVHLYIDFITKKLARTFIQASNMKSVL